MRLLVVLFSFIIASQAFALTFNKTAYDLEQHYQGIAQILADQHEQNVCGGDVEAYTPDIVDSARMARYYFDFNQDWYAAQGKKFSLAPSTVRTMGTTMALKDIMNMLDYNDPQTFAHALNRVIMWGPAPGAYGNTTYLKFGTQGEVISAELIFSNNSFDWQETSGRFFVYKQNNQILVEVNVNGDIKTYILQKDNYSRMWVLIPSQNPTANPYFDGFVDYPSECEA